MNKAQKLIVTALFMTTFLAAIEGTIVATAMPAITGDLNGMQYYSWVNSIYLLAMAVTVPLYGKLSDIYGRKSLIIIGTLIFTLGSACAGLAWDMISLVVFRAIQGIGGAALISLPMIIIADIFELDMRSKMQGLMSSVWGVAGILGPVSGGLLVDFISWRSVFYINVPFAVIALLMLVYYLPAKKVTSKVSIDFKGIALFTLAMLLFMYSISEMKAAFEKHSTLGIIHIVLLGVSIVLIALFNTHEKSVKSPFISPTLFKNKLLLFTIIVGFVISAITIAVIYYVPLWLQDMQGYNATYSGLIMIPLSITWPLSSVLSGYLLPKLGLFKVNILGVIALLFSALGFAYLQPETPHWILMAIIAMAGMSYGFLFSAGTILSSTVTSVEERGTAMSLVQVSRSLGQTLGLTIWGLFIFSEQAHPLYTQKLAQSIHLVFVLIGILTLAIVCYIVYILMQDKQAISLGLAGKKKIDNQING